ncbi:MAG: hypothetical protein MR432_03970 [Prevotellaceae bacterium]|nr:hypothetical protein [Prevotellaceae bacterium]MDD7376018.1 hypothetical protein [Prevotellaceae bacterium]
MTVFFAPTINHAKTQKGRDALIAFSFEAASDGNLRPSLRKHHAYALVHLLTDGQRSPNRTTFFTIIPVTFISNKFPRLLAEREIIANAFLFTDKILPPHKEAASQSYELFQERGGIVRQIFRSYRTHL